jgi:hypothetical protein
MPQPRRDQTHEQVLILADFRDGTSAYFRAKTRDYPLGDPAARRAACYTQLKAFALKLPRELAEELIPKVNAFLAEGQDQPEVTAFRIEPL